MVTIREVAQQAKVSTATVSYVINGTKNVSPEIRQRVLKAIEELDYQPNQIAQSLRLKSTNTIGVLVEDIMAFPITPIINGISEFVENSEYKILLSDLRMLDHLYNQYDKIDQYKDKINDAISFLLFGARVDAIIYVGMFDRNITGIINDIEKPLVVAYSTTAERDICHVTYDSKNISADAIRYLLDHGHTQIAVITGLAHTSPAKQRMRGVQQAFHEAGIVLDSCFVKNGDWEYASGHYCMMELLAQDTVPTAVFAMNDLMAAGAMDAVRSVGINVPDDISIIGFDNRELAAYLHPKLTTVEIDLNGIGRIAAEMALKLIDGKQIENRKRTLASKLIIRETVAQK